MPIPASPSPPPPPDHAPPLYTTADIHAKLNEWRVEFHDAIGSVEEHPATRKCICDRCVKLRECRDELDMWLDRLLEVRGR